VHVYNDPSTLKGVKPYAVDANNAIQLWKKSEIMTGVAFEAK